MSVAEIFNGMAGRFQADKAAGATMGILFDLSGDDGGQYYVNIADGKLDVSQSAPAAAPSATVKMSADDFKAMSSGSLNPMMAFMTGKIKVEGDMSVAMALSQLL